MAICGVLFPNTNSHSDFRGDFIKTFAQEREPHITQFVVAESFFSRTIAGAARGMHLQVGKGASNRLISCVQGKIFDVLVDLRKNSETYLQIDSLIMGPEKVSSVYVPAGVAHGFLALEDSITSYISDRAHNPSLDTGVRLTSLNLEWPLEKMLLSERDELLPSLKQWIQNQQ